MSSQLRYLLTYEQMVANLLRTCPEEEAMARAVGGDYHLVGALEHALLRGLGLGPGASVVDVGCGSGRLAVQLARYEGLRYLGLDVVPALLDYARRKAGRPDFRFERVDRIALPAADASADFVVFFSVFTHLLHEESYVYLQEALRVLKPGGRAVFSFLEYDLEGAWQVFEGNVEWVRNRSLAGHLNVFLNRRDLRLWARRLGFRVEAMHAGDERFVTVDAASATEALPPGTYALGQSVCVFRKPLRDDRGTAEVARPQHRRAEPGAAEAASQGEARAAPGMPRMGPGPRRAGGGAPDRGPAAADGKLPRRQRGDAPGRPSDKECPAGAAMAEAGAGPKRLGRAAGQGAARRPGRGHETAPGPAGRGWKGLWRKG